MRLRVLSDLHLEFHQDKGVSFIQDQSDSDYDILILAGDITICSYWEYIFPYILKAAKNRPVIYVPGNHEYYHHTYKQVNKLIKKFSKNNLFILNNKSVVLDDIKFVGSTLWFNCKLSDPDNNLMGDFKNIPAFNELIAKQGKVSADFLEKEISGNEVVITHHLPCNQSVHSIFKHSSLNKYFVNDVQELVENRDVKLWVHGHTHCSMDYIIGSTRVICNPFGYLRIEQNALFNEKLTIDI